MLFDKNEVMAELPKYLEGIKPLVQLSAFLYQLVNGEKMGKFDRHVYMIQKIHALFCDKIKDLAFQEGIHKLILSILAALMTQSDQAVRMYPMLTGLGKSIPKV